jgi:hypothetical protein
LCRASPSGGIPGGTTSAAPPTAATPCNANREQHFQQKAVAEYSILGNRTGPEHVYSVHHLGGNPVEWEYTLARLVYDLKLIYAARDGRLRGGQRILIVKLFWTTVAESPVTRIVIR